jgi:hypothetical protein
VELITTQAVAVVAITALAALVEAEQVALAMLGLPQQTAWLVLPILVAVVEVRVIAIPQMVLKWVAMVVLEL